MERIGVEVLDDADDLVPALALGIRRREPVRLRIPETAAERIAVPQPLCGEGATDDDDVLSAGGVIARLEPASREQPGVVGPEEIAIDRGADRLPRDSGRWRG